MGANTDAQRERVETAHQTLAARATSPAPVRAANVACVRVHDVCWQVGKYVHLHSRKALPVMQR